MRQFGRKTEASKLCPPDKSLLHSSCADLKSSGRDADHPLKVKGELALVREAGAERDFGQAELAICPQEVLGSFNAARDHILVRRQPSGHLELARKVIGAEMNDGSHLFHRRVALEIFHDVLDDRVELAARKHAVGSASQLARP